MQILALDLATKTGWAHSCSESGVWDLSIKKDESSGMRLLRFRGKLREVIDRVGVDVIVFEEVSVARGVKANLDGVKLSSKLQAIVEELCETSGIEHCSFNPQTIKTHAIPSGVGKVVRDKQAMIEAARRRWPDVEWEDENEVDAKWLLDLAMKELSPNGNQ